MPVSTDRMKFKLVEACVLARTRKTGKVPKHQALFGWAVKTRDAKVMHFC